MQSTKTKQLNFADNVNKIEKDMVDLDKLTNVKKIVDKNKSMLEQIDVLEKELDNMKTNIQLSKEDIKIDETNVDIYMNKLKQLEEKHHTEINLDESIANYHEATSIIKGLRKYYEQLKMEVTQLK